MSLTPSVFRPPDAGDHFFSGRIDSLVFIGEAYEGEITIQRSQLFIKTEPDSDIQVGDRANFSVDPNHCLLVTR